jgi:ribosomal protein L11 methyltransferase
VNYIEIKIHVSQENSQKDILIAELSDLGFESFVEEDNILLAYIPEDSFSPDSLKLLDKREVKISVIPDQNWNAVWESNYQPVIIANQCLIRAPFHDADPDMKFDIVLQPKMAFGTAHHETTAMMIERLLEEKVTGKRILDMGCGTGVLAILAALKGAKDITAIDNDEWAFRNSIENKKLNGLDFIHVEMGEAGSLKDKGYFDLILANINKNILLTDMQTYCNSLSQNGKIIFSGFYLDDLDDIKKEAKQNGMNFVSNISRNNWVAAIFIKQ